MIAVELEEDLLDGIEQFIAARDEPPRGRMSCDDAVNVIIKDWLMSQGYLPLPDAAGAVTPALEAAEVPGSQS